MLSVLVFSIGLSFWVQYARTVRGSVMVEKNKDYHRPPSHRAAGARHHGPARAAERHGAGAVIATINLALAIITEATLSFLGSGMPRRCPSLGTLIRIGSNYLFSGEWWIVAFRASRSPPSCWPSIFWATGSGTLSARDCGRHRFPTPDGPGRAGQNPHLKSL